MRTGSHRCLGASRFAVRHPSPSVVAGVDLRVASQLGLLDSLSRYYAEQPFSHDPQPPLRYYFRNIYFTQADAIVLYSMLRHWRPRKVIEIGSGFSSAVMLDTNDLFLDGSVELLFVEPFPKRLFTRLSLRDRGQVTVVEEPVQHLQPEFFGSLAAGDFLFVDSSHVVKIGSSRSSTSTPTSASITPLR